MTFKLPLSAAFAALIALSSLAACGGGEGDSPPASATLNPAALTKTDTKIGAGAEAVRGKTVKVHYTGWLYTAGAANFKGAQFDSSVGKASPYAFTLGANTVIEGFEQGILGMKVGGKRTVLIPSSLAYGASGKDIIPPNAGLVFDIELIEVN